jgi:hypothetical protein
MLTDKTTILWQIDLVLIRFRQVDQGSGEQWDELEEAEVSALVRNAIELFRPPNASVYNDEALAAMMSDSSGLYLLRRMVGLLTALRADYEADRLRTVSELVHADLFDDFLEMATHLLEQNYKDAAAVTAGAVLEEHLRKLCGRHSVPTLTDKGQPKKLDTMNADLAKAGVYNTIEQKDITTQAGIRNAAAHGKYGEYDVDRVRRMIEVVRGFIARHPV